MAYNCCSMSIRHKTEINRARKGKTIPRIQEREIGRLWQCKKEVVIPIIIGALDAIDNGFRTWIRKMQIENYCKLMQKACLLGTAEIIRKVLDT